MAKLISLLLASSASLAFTLAACGGGGGDADSDTDGGNGDGDGDGDGDNIMIGDGDFVSPDIIFESPPRGFQSTVDDGSGNPVYVGPAFPPETITLLAAGAAAGLTPAAENVFFYPFPDTMVPGNLAFINIQWKSPDGTYSQVLVRITAPGATYHAYLTATCASSGYCNVDIPKQEWLTLGANHAGETVEFEVISTNGTDTIITESLPLRYSPEPLIGALYYWASASRVIKRAAFGAEAATDFIVPGVHTEYECVSCHSVSRDGSTIAYGVSPEHGENISGIQVTSTADPTMSSVIPTNGTTPFSATVANGNTEGPIDNLGHNVALNRDGSLMAVNATSPPDNWPSRLDIRSTQAPDTVVFSYEFSDSGGLFGAGRMAIHPEYSPDGSKMVVTLAVSDGNMSAWSNTSGGIGILDVGADGSLSNLREVITPPVDGSFHFYPTWSPDSKYVAFMTSWDTNGNVGSLGNDHAVIHMIDAATTGGACPGAGCIELTRGTGYDAAAAQAMSGTFGSTWPKFAPFAQGAAKNVYFITFTTRRQVGSFNDVTTQIWMFGIDTAALPSDPSFSPFWLPYQNAGDGSLAPYWTEVLPCNIDGGTCNGCLATEKCLVNQDTNACRCEVPPVTK